MDLAWIVGLIAAVLGGGGLSALLLHKQNKRKTSAETGHTKAKTKLTDAQAALLDAQKEGEESGQLISIIGILRGELDRLSERLGALEARVTELEKENRGLRRTVDTLLNLVRRMWSVIRDNEVDIDPELAGDIYDAIEDSTA